MNISEFQGHLKASGLKALCGAENTVWVSHERFSMLRLPACALNVPAKEEIARIFRECHPAMLSYAVTPSPERPTNAILYLCSDPDYSIEKLEKSVRYDVRRGMKQFEIRFLEQDEVLRLGKQAYCDTLARTGLSVAHREAFEHAFARKRGERRYLGTIRDGRLAAFLQLVAVNDWVSIGGYSADEFLSFCPNNALICHAVRYCLAEKKARVVDYGFSSIQAVSNADGLHRFKVRMGFEAVPIHRVFSVNPMLKPFVNRVSAALVNGMLRLSPRHPVLKKAEGALRMAMEGSNG